MTGFEGMCMSQGKFLKPWQVTDNIIEWIFMQVTFNFLQVTNSKNNNSQGFENSRMVSRGCVWVGEFLKPWQVTDRIIEWIFMQFTFNILWVTLTQKIISQGFENSWMDMRGCVWVGESFWNHDKWHKIIEWIFSQFTFNILWVTNSKNNNS